MIIIRSGWPIKLKLVDSNDMIGVAEKVEAAEAEAIEAEKSSGSKLKS